MSSTPGQPVSGLDDRSVHHGSCWHRVDAGRPAGSGRSSLLHVFGIWAPCSRRVSRVVPKVERRQEERHEVECRAWLGWKTWRSFSTVDAVLVDLSRGGARIFLDSPPPVDQKIWIFLETAGGNAIVKARVRGVETTPCGQCSIRVEFDEPCPFAVFEAAVCGLAPIDPSRRAIRKPGVIAS